MAAPVALDRLQLGGAAVLSPTRAAELLPVRETEALKWLRHHDLIHEVPGLGEVVVWGEVIAQIVKRETADAPLEISAPSTVRGTRLRRGRI